MTEITDNSGQSWKDLAQKATRMAELLEGQKENLLQQVSILNSQLTKYEARYETDMHYQKRLEDENTKLKERVESLKADKRSSTSTEPTMQDHTREFLMNVLPKKVDRQYVIELIEEAIAVPKAENEKLQAENNALKQTLKEAEKALIASRVVCEGESADAEIDLIDSVLTSIHSRFPQ